MSYYESSRITLVAASALAADSLVKLDANGKAAVCAASDMPIGVTETGATAAGEHVGVRLLNCSGTIEVNTGAAISLGDELAAGADGKAIRRTADAQAIGVALRAAVPGSVVEMLPLASLAPSYHRAFTASAAITAGALVKMTASGLAVCTASDTPIGVALNAASAAGASVNVQLWTDPGIMTVIASAAIAQGANVSSAASGKAVTTASSAPVIGIALTAATAADATFDLLPL